MDLVLSRLLEFAKGTPAPASAALTMAVVSFYAVYARQDEAITSDFKVCACRRRGGGHGKRGMGNVAPSRSKAVGGGVVGVCNT